MRSASPLLVAATACLALFLVILDNTIVNVAIVPISQALSADVHTIQWVVGAYFLAQAAVIPVTGYLAVRFGSRRVFLWALVLFVVSSGLCGSARTGYELIGYRVLQGFGGGALYPLAQSIAFGAYSGRERIKGVSLTMIPGVLAPTLGPVSGGWLTLHYGWPSIFLVNVPLGVLFLFMSWRFLPKDLPARTQSRFDGAGLALCLVGVLSLTYGFSLVGTPIDGTVDSLHPQGVPHGWGAPLTLTCLSLGALTLAWFVVHELGRVGPVLDLRLFLRREFSVASLIASLNNGIFFGSMLVLPFFLIHVRSPHLTSLEVGLLLAPQGLGSALMLVVGAKLRRYWGAGPLIVLGSALLALSSWGVAHASTEPGISAFLPWIFVRGMGFGTVFQQTQGMVVEGLARQELPQATSLFNVVRQISSSIGLALLLSIFGHESASRARSLQLSAAAPLATEALLHQAGTAAFVDLFQLLAGVSILGLVLAALLLNTSPTKTAPEGVPGAVAQPGATP
jgi:EmrB/QacA subfamily drug resistance transporter